MPGSQRPRRLRRVLFVLLLFLAVVLAGGAIATSLISAQAERDFPRRGEFVEVRGTKQHYVASGSPNGTPIVFVHGAFGASQDFAATITPDLEQRYYCVAWDRPGHGYSERPNGVVVDPAVQAEMLLEFIDVLGLEQPLLVGFSYGGAVALSAALADPSAMRGVVMLNGPSHPWPDPIDFEYTLPEVPILGPLATATITTPLGHALASHSVSLAFAPEAVVPDFLERSPIGLALRPTSYRANAEDIASLKPCLARQVERYDELRVPITMLVSEGDTVVSPTIHSLQLEQAAKRFSMRRLEGAGHQVLYAHPATCIEVIESALR